MLHRIGTASSARHASIYAARRSASTTTPPPLAQQKKRSDGGGLSLGLDFSNMNFAAMAKNIKAALRSEEDFRKDVMLGGVVAELDSFNQSLAAPQHKVKSSDNPHHRPPPLGGPASHQRADVSGNTSWASSIAEATHHRSSSDARGGGGGGSYTNPAAKRTLKERLQDCVVSGNWTKAMQMFSKAVQESNAALASAARRHTATTTAATSTIAVSADVAVHSSTAAPDDVAVSSTGNDDGGVDDQSSISFYQKDHAGAGLSRWNGNHIQTVLRCVVNAEVPDALRRVWHVVMANGVMQHRFDAHNLNSIIGIVSRRAQQQPQAVIGGGQRSAVKPAMEKHEWDQFVSEWRQLRRQITIDVATFAAAANIELNEASQRTYQRILEQSQRQQVAAAALASSPLPHDSSSSASLPVDNVQDFNRMLEALVKKEEGNEGGATTTIADQPNPSAATSVGTNLGDVVTTTTVSGSGSADSIARGDTESQQQWTVDTLLAASSTNNSSVAFRWNERTYSILLHRLLRRQRRAVSARGAEETVHPIAASESFAPSPALQEGKTLWEQSPMLIEAEPIFAQYLEHVGPHRYPAPFLIADMLEFVKHRRSLDPRVYQFVALLLQPDARSMFVETMTAVPPPSAPPLQHPLPWGGRGANHLPSPKVFEVLIRHALHMGRPAESRFWYDEMRHLGVRGTGVVYHTMMDIAAKNPPTRASSSSLDERGTTERPVVEQRDSQQEILDVYGQMKEVGLDVTNVSTTVSLINAWSNKHQANFRRRSR
jgi:hypothetical protein